MSARTAIYAVNPGDTAEVRRVLRICLAGMRPPAALTCCRDFLKWAEETFLPVMVPHVIAIHRMALAGDGDAVIRADSALQPCDASAVAGRELLSRRTGSRQLPAVRRFAAAVATGKTPAHFATVTALYGADFSIALLPLLQSVLFCEWSSVQPVGSSREMEDFFIHARPVMASVVALLTPPGPGPAEAVPQRLKVL